MYMDKKLMFSTDQAVAAGLSKDTLDLGKSGNAYEEVQLVVLLDTPLTAVQTLSVAVESCDTETGTYVKSATFEAVQLKNQAIAQRMPYGLKQYVRLSYAVTGAPVGKLSAGLVLDVKI